jgi:CheY-like chemotaxis protein
MIYIVDDGADYRYLLEQVFSRFLSQYPVRFFAHGEELHQHLLTSPVLPALILLDLDMPVLDGRQTLLLLKGHAQWKRVPTVIMTSSSSGGEISQCYDVGANSFLMKPAGFAELKQSMEIICLYWLEMNQRTKQV